MLGGGGGSKLQCNMQSATERAERERSTRGDRVLFSSVGLWEGFLGVKITRIPYHYRALLITFPRASNSKLQQQKGSTQFWWGPAAAPTKDSFAESGGIFSTGSSVTCC